MKLSYLITTKNETDTLLRLLQKLHTATIDTENEVVILDDYSDNNETINILNDYKNKPNFKLYHDGLNNNYGRHKNVGIEKCSGNWIFQLDGDEYPSDLIVGDNLISIIESNNVEAIALPRINDFKGVQSDHAQAWGWTLTISKTYKSPIINWPDYQFRVFFKDYPRISYLRRLHEKIEGYGNYALLPADEDYAIYHDKNIEKQIRTNLKYNEVFTKEENMGHRIV
jgi:glycosyltransferase involved in cell wall biosynthesis